MNKYAIKNLAELTGIKAHTIRAWEKRYGLIKPKRTDTNIRYYTDEDLKYLLNVSLLNRYGYKISQISCMSQLQINDAVHSVTGTHIEYQSQVNLLTVAMVEFNEVMFEKILSRCILRYGLEHTIVRIIYPFLEKVGIMWQTSCITPCHEHFISGLIRQKMHVAIDGQEIASEPDAHVYMLFLPENEQHEIGLLMGYYALKCRNQRVVYLGANVPFEDIKKVYNTTKPDFLLTIATTYPSGTKFIEWTRDLSATFTSARILISGYQTLLNKETIQPYAKVLDSVSDLSEFINIERKSKIKQ